MKIQTKIFITIFVLIIVADMAVTVVSYTLSKDTAEKEICNHLLTAAESRADHVETVLMDYKQYTRMLAVGNTVTNGADERIDYSKRMGQMSRRINATLKSRGDICSIVILNKNGTVVASNLQDITGRNDCDSAVFLKGKEGDYVGDIRIGEVGSGLVLPVASPVFVDDEFSGVCVINFAVEEELYEITTDRTGLGETGEIFLVNEDSYMITPSRFINGTFLTQKIETFHPGSESEPEDVTYLAGYKHEVLLCKSYRGAEVLRVCIYMPDMGWTLVAEKDKGEAYAPVAAITDMLVFIFVGLSLLGMLLGITISAIISGTITKPIVKLHHGTEEIMRGNLDHRIGTSAKNEVGQLSRALDSMTANFRKSKEELEEYSRGLAAMVEERTAELDAKIAESEQQRLATLNIAEDIEEINVEMETEIAERKKIENDLRDKQIAEAAYSDILTVTSGTIDLDTIVTESLNGLMWYADAPLGAVYLYDHDRKMLFPAAVKDALDVVATRVFAYGKGIPGETAAKKEMVVVSDVPSDTIYRIKSGDITVPPDLIISAPIIFKDALLGVVLTCYNTRTSQDMINFVKRVTDQLAVAINNANAYTEMQEMAAELKSERDKLKITSLELAAASRTKSEFLANMSHELRTPLNSIIGFSEILHDGVFGPVNEKQAKYVNNVLVSGKHLLQLINDILDLSKVEAGKIVLDCKDFPASDAINEVRTLTASIAAKKSIVVDASVDEGLTTIYADEGKFKQILYNLLSNAIKFTPEGGSVTVDARRQGDMAEISVADTGIGISKEDQKKLFHPFMQADASTSREYGGTGLGLSLVKKFTELHGGTVRIESEPGEGSTFAFTIPVAGRAEAETDAEATEEGVEVADEAEMPEKMHEVPAVVDAVTAEELAATPMPAIIEPAGGSGDEPLVLVVEDDINSSELLTVTLTGAGYRVIPTRNGREALAVAKRLKPFAITLDIMMPGMDGWDVLKYLKYDPETSNIPVIVISMLDETEVGFSLGVADYFVKPVEKRTLVAALNNLTGVLEIDMPKVLVVDDEPAAVELVASMIEPAGFKVLCAYGGEEGISKSFSEHPDVLILDLMMPDLSGFDVVSRLKMDPETRNIPIIICTSKDPTSEDIIRLRSDVISVMRKGEFARDELVNEIKKVATLVRR